MNQQPEKRQRVIFVNLHANWLMMRTPMNYIFKFSSATKHAYILQYLLQHPEKYEVCNYINDRGFSLLDHGAERLQPFLNLFSGLENRLTLRKNKIPRKSVTVLRRTSDIRNDDIVLIYNVFTPQYRQISDVKAFKALSMLHFHGRADEDALIEMAGVQCYYNEVDLSKTSEIFRKYYHVERPWVVIPFVFAQRFQNIKPFDQRHNKCFSTGTITYKEHPEFLSVYTDPCDQPARKFVKDNPEFFADTVDCYSSDYLEDNPGKPVRPGDNPLKKLYKQIYNRTHIGKQKKYFSFDMVEKFNDYKMHLLGEEILGVPGIGFVEGMACGSAYIGLDSPMYRDLGLVPGVHYITYDGTKEGLRDTVRHWQRPENQAELAKIADAGCRYVRENFCGTAAAEGLLAGLQQQQQAWLDSRGTDVAQNC